MMMPRRSKTHHKTKNRKRIELHVIVVQLEAQMMMTFEGARDEEEIQSNTGTTTTIPVFISQQTLFKCRTQNRGQDLVIPIQRDQHSLTTTAFKTKIDSQEMLKIEHKSFLRNSCNIPIPLFSASDNKLIESCKLHNLPRYNFAAFFLHFNTLIVFPSVWRNDFMIPSFIPESGFFFLFILHTSNLFFT